MLPRPHVTGRTYVSGFNCCSSSPVSSRLSSPDDEELQRMDVTFLETRKPARDRKPSQRALEANGEVVIAQQSQPIQVPRLGTKKRKPTPANDERVDANFSEHGSRKRIGKPATSRAAPPAKTMTKTGGTVAGTKKPRKPVEGTMALHRGQNKSKGGGWKARPTNSNIAALLDLPDGCKLPNIARTSPPVSKLKAECDDAMSGGSAAYPRPAKVEPPKKHPKKSTITIKRSGLSEGYPSSRFCRVLRLVASLPPLKVLTTPKPQKPPNRRPPVWAESRQELCEALPYYRAFQSGLYMYNRVAFGYLLEAFPAPRDIWAQHGKIIISHGGGQCVRTTDGYGRKSDPQLSADQSSDDARVDTLIQAHLNRNPLILIAGEGYEHLPWSLSCAYAVLGWYWISAVWVEAETVAPDITPPAGRSYFHRYKIRFDWVQTQGDPWWSGITPNEQTKPPSALSPPSPTDPSEILDGLSAMERDMPLARRIDICNLCNPPSDLTTTLPSVFDPTTGLLTPPTSPERRFGDHEKKTSLNDHKESASWDDRSSDTDLTWKSESEDDIMAWTSDEEDPGHSPWAHRKPGRALLRPDKPIASSSDDVPAFQSISKLCPSCSQSSPRVYVEAWICFNPKCRHFWCLESSVGLIPIPMGFGLSYSREFLRCADSPTGWESLPYALQPLCAAAGDRGAGSSSLARGWVCDRCGRANCRYKWECWECLNCGHVLHHLHQESLTMPRALDTLYPFFLGDAKVHPDSGIQIMMRSLGLPEVVIITYTLPNHHGKIHHIIPREKVVANTLWEAYQLEAVVLGGSLFQRRPIKTNTVKGRLLAQHFAVNSGVKYKYIVETLSLTLDESPCCIRNALKLIRRTANTVLGVSTNFNEVLSLYRDGQKMSWHDDGEDSLGPTIASLSLGSPATMSWRPKGERHVVNMPYYQGREAKRKQPYPIPVLSLILSHGDLIVMQGRHLQEKYSHRVIPHGFRVAATAREIYE